MCETDARCCVQAIFKVSLSLGEHVLYFEKTDIFFRKKIQSLVQISTTNFLPTSVLSREVVSYLCKAVHGVCNRN